LEEEVLTSPGALYVGQWGGRKDRIARRNGREKKNGSLIEKKKPLDSLSLKKKKFRNDRIKAEEQGGTGANITGLPIVVEELSTSISMRRKHPRKR